MAVSDALHHAPLSRADASEALPLSEEAGWNQTIDDWRLFIERGHTLGVRDADGRLVATAAALPYDGPLGYIGMVLVTAAWRRKGLATRVVDACVAHLGELGLVPALDATAAGETVYSQQGFRTIFTMDRWQGRAAAGVADADGDTDGFAQLDAEAFGARRGFLIADFARRAGTGIACEEGGFGMIRRGRRALQIGPVVAGDETKALSLFERLVAPGDTDVFVDVPSRWTRIGAWLGQRGFTIQRSFSRMALHRAEPFGRPEMLFAAAGPEFG